MKHPASLLGFLFLAACSPVTIRPDGGPRDTNQSTFEIRNHFWLWGLVGEAHVDARTACGDRKVDQMQSVYTGTDLILNLATLGIYAPRSARVWCD
jgi:hypothetical protein